MHDVGRAMDGGDDFERWLIHRSFRMLMPLYRLGLLVAALMLLVVDPLLFSNGTWGDKPHHMHLLVWHGCAAVYFALFLCLVPRLVEHRARKRCLLVCMTLGAALFTWFGFISWVLSGDMSTYAIFLLTTVCVFGDPSVLRRGVGIVSTAILLAAIVWFDGISVFYTSGAAINLIALAVVAVLLDGHLMAMNRALYDETRLVQQERARADAVLFNAFPVAIANELKRGMAVVAQQHTSVAVLFVDIVGFTEFAATHPPDTVLRVLDDVFSQFDALVDRHGVEKIKTIGDAYMVIGKDATGPVAALALDMLAAVDDYNLRSGHRLTIRAGMHVGPAITGVIGVKRLHYDVWGDTVNIASRMESTGQPGKVQVSASVWQLLRGQHRFACRGTIPVKGKQAMCTFFLLDHGDAIGVPTLALEGADAGAPQTLLAA